MKSELFQLYVQAKRIWSSLSRRERTLLTLALALMAVTGFLASVPPLIIGGLIDRILRSNGQNLAEIALPSVMIIVVAFVLRECLQVCRKYLIESVCTLIEKQKLIEAVSHVLQLDFSSAEKSEATGALNGRIHRSVEGFIRLLKLCFLDLFPITIIAFFALGAALTQNAGITLLMFLVVPIGFLIVLRQLQTQKGIRLELLKAKNKIDGRVVELLNGREYVRAANTELFEVEKIESVAENLRRKELKHHIAMMFYDAFKYLNEGTFSVLVLVFSLYMVSTGAITPGDVLKFSLLFSSVLMPLRELHRIIDEAHESSLRTVDYFDLVDAPVDISYAVPTDIAPVTAKTMEALIELRDVSFSYNEAKVLDNVNFEIRAGEKIGIAGRSGGGKSTLIKLLLRLHHLKSGKIFVNGRDLITFSREEIAAQFGYVGQNPFLFSGTISENITYGVRSNITQDKIVAVAKQANIHNEILALPKAYESILEENGKDLSGGQRQRLAIARVLLLNPPILLLDEATSALDVKNEQIVQETLNAAMSGRTVISVSHRTSALQRTDKVLFIENGKIAESGSFDDLIGINGAFAALIRPNANGKTSNRSSINSEEFVYKSSLVINGK